MAGKSRIATICARGGSKGVPGKNLAELEGEPLVARAVRQARESGVFTAIAVSSDEHEILTAGTEAGATIVVERPQVLASDEAGKLGAIRHAVGVAESKLRLRFDTVVDLDVTTPLRQPCDIAEVVERLEASAATVVLTASEARRSPYFNLVQTDEDGVPSLPCGAANVLRRQDSPPVYDLTGAVYAWTREAIDEGQLLGASTVLHLLPPDRAWDVDTPMDLQIVRCLLELRARPDVE